MIKKRKIRNIKILNKILIVKNGWKGKNKFLTLCM